MNPQDSLLLARGAGGVGSWTLNRNFVREFGSDAALILSDMFRAYHYGDKIHTNIEKWFLWNPNSMMSLCRWSDARFYAAMDILIDNHAFKIKQTDNEIRFCLQFNYLQEIGGALSLKGIEYEKEVR